MKPLIIKYLAISGGDGYEQGAYPKSRNDYN